MYECVCLYVGILKLKPRPTLRNERSTFFLLLLLFLALT